MIQENEPWKEDAPAKISAPMGSIFPIIKVLSMHKSYMHRRTVNISLIYPILCTKSYSQVVTSLLAYRLLFIEG